MKKFALLTTAFLFSLAVMAQTAATKVDDVVVDWNQDSDYKAGDYKIEIFQGGFAVGSGNVTLR